MIGVPKPEGTARPTLGMAIPLDLLLEDIACFHVPA